jgi:hypothetical protein
MPESFSASNNNVRIQREEVLGWTKQQLADFAKSKVGVQLSSKTIERVERGEGNFARVTFTRLLRVLNAAREKNGLASLTHEDLFPTMMPRHAHRKKS